MGPLLIPVGGSIINSAGGTIIYKTFCGLRPLFEEINPTASVGPLSDLLDDMET